MEVDDGEVTQVPGRKQAPVRAAAGDRQLPQIAEAVRLRRDVPDALRHPRGVVLARVVGEPRFGEDVVGPGRAAVDREGRRAVCDGALACRFGDRLDRAVEIGAELLSCLVVDARMRMAVTRRLVPAPDDLGDERAVTLDAHPEEEERGARAELVEQVEELRRLALERRVRSIPVGEPESPVHELVPVLEVDRQQQARARVHVANLAAPETPSSDPGCHESGTFRPQAGWPREPWLKLLGLTLGVGKA